MARTKTKLTAKQAEAKKARRLTKLKENYVERRGGYRVGAGRPPGALTVVKRQISIRNLTETIIREGKLPLRTMINNMVFYEQQAMELEQMLMDAMSDGTFKKDADKLLRAIELFAQVSDTRMKSQKCAVDAAPFLHPRLSQMQLNVNPNATPRDLTEDADIGKYREDFNSLRGQALTLDNDTGVPVVDDEESEDA